MKCFRWLTVLGLVALATWRLSPYFSDFSQLLTLAENISWLWIGMAIIAQAIEYIGDGWLSQLVLRIAGTRINFLKTLQIASIDVFAAHILPLGEIGTIATTYYFYRKLGVNNQNLIFLTAAWGLVTGITLIVMFLLSALFLPSPPHSKIHITSLAAAIMVFFILVILAIFSTKKIIWPKIKKLLFSFTFTREVLIFGRNFAAHGKALKKHKGLIIQSLLAGFIYYAGNILTLIFCFLAFGKLPSIALIAFAYFASLLAGFITLAPAGIGATEASMLLIFHEFGIAPALSLAATLSFRLISFWLPIPVGFLAFRSMMKKKP